jgi:succinyl-diaminopimelate desuccinylase
MPAQKEIDYLSLVKNRKQEILEHLSALIKINSVFDASTKKASKPFGEGVSKALQLLGKIAKNEGFNVDYCNGYVTEISYGSHKESIAIVTHADIVPLGNPAEWSYDPLCGNFSDGEFIKGRGSQDDKGPLIAGYFVLKIIKELGLKMNKKIMLIAGGNEERGSACLKYYFNTLKKPQPTYAFTPDAGFPLIYGEKGITNISILATPPTYIKSFTGGLAHNMVVAETKVVVDKALVDPATLHLESKATFSIDKNTLTVKGKSAHGATPEEGINAAIGAFEYFAKAYKDPFFIQLYKVLSNCYGEGFGGNITSPELKHLSMNLGLVSYSDSKLYIGLNFRYPENTNARLIADKIEAALSHQHLVSIESDTLPLLIPKESPLVSTLMGAYRHFVDDPTPPMTIGGGTYSKDLTNCVAFGMGFRDTVELAHQNDEQLKIDDLLLGTAIYLKAVIDLDALPSQED